MCDGLRLAGADLPPVDDDTRVAAELALPVREVLLGLFLVHVKQMVDVRTGSARLEVSVFGELLRRTIELYVPVVLLSRGVGAGAWQMDLRLLDIAMGMSSSFTYADQLRDIVESALSGDFVAVGL